MLFRSEQIPVIGSIAKVVTFRTYEDKKDNFEADIKVPQVTIEGTEGAQVDFYLPVNL